MSIDTVVILGTYNGSEYLADFLDSLERQSYQQFSIFVSDDNSSDNTVEILKQSTFYSSGRMTIVTNSYDRGASNNFMSAIKNAPTAKYYLFADQDDFWLPNKILLMKLQLQKSNQQVPVVLFSDLVVTDSNLKVISNSYFRYAKYHINSGNLSVNRLLVENRIPGCAMCVNSVLIEYIRDYIFPESVYMHDYMAIEIAAFLGEIHFLNESLILYRQHESNTIGAPHKSFNSYLHRIYKGIDKYGFELLTVRKRKMGIKQRQAKALLALPNAAVSNSFAVVSQFSELQSFPKFKRVSFVLRNGIYYDSLLFTLLELITI